jgi:hypothetical protein
MVVVVPPIRAHWPDSPLPSCSHQSSPLCRCLPQLAFILKAASPIPTWLALLDGTFFSLPHSESFQFPDSSGFHSCSGEWLVFLRNGGMFLNESLHQGHLSTP